MIDASLIAWESGTDLVIDTEVEATPDQVWRRIVESDECAQWFAPFTRVGDDRVRFHLDDGEEAAGEGAAGEGAAAVVAGAGEDLAGADPEADGSLEAEVLSCEEDSHVLLEFAALGRLGISLRPIDVGTRISLTCTFASSEEAAEILPEVGPVWETHLRLLREAVGAGASDVPESELTARYERLAAQAQDDSDSDELDSADPSSADGASTDPGSADPGSADPSSAYRAEEEPSGIDYGTHDFGSHDPGATDAADQRPAGDGRHDS